MPRNSLKGSAQFTSTNRIPYGSGSVVPTFTQDVVDIIKSEYEFMQEQGFASPHRPFNHVMTDMAQMIFEETRDPHTFMPFKRPLANAYENGGKESLIGTFSGMIGKTLDFTRKKMNDHSAQTVVNTAQTIRDIEEKSGTAQTAIGRLKNVFDLPNFDNAQPRIDSLVENAGHSAQYMLQTGGSYNAVSNCCNPEEPVTVTREVIMDLAQNGGFPFKGLPKDYVAVRLAMLSGAPAANGPETNPV